MDEIVWTDAHKREALRRTFEIAAMLACAHPSDAEELCMSARMYAEDERAFRVNLCGYGDIDERRIDREVRRVDALATGRLVRETAWQARHVGGSLPLAECDTREASGAWIARGYIAAPTRIVRVTRIRRPA